MGQLAALVNYAVFLTFNTLTFLNCRSFIFFSLTLSEILGFWLFFLLLGQSTAGYPESPVLALNSFQ